jgi:hypothetical protein
MEVIILFIIESAIAKIIYRLFSQRDKMAINYRTIMPDIVQLRWTIYSTPMNYVGSKYGSNGNYDGNDM